jgi:hypothetical protein
MFASDRDLLALEPNLFRDVGWVGQRLIKATGAIAGSTLTLTGADVALDVSGVGAGHVATVNGVGYEVIAVLSATQATVSRLRADAAGPVIPPSPVTGAETFVHTFAPQLGIVHAQLLRMVGIEPGDPESGVTEACIVNAAALLRLEALGALYLIYAAASGPTGPGSAQGQRAEFYRSRFAEERERAAVRLDLDGDGVADATRRFNVVQFVRG